MKSKSKYKMKRVVALFLTLALCFGTAPFLAFAEAYEAGAVVSELEGKTPEGPVQPSDSGDVVSIPSTQNYSNSAEPPASSTEEQAEIPTYIGEEGEGLVLYQEDIPTVMADNGIQTYAAPESAVLTIGWATIGADTGNLSSIGSNLTQCPTKMTLTNGVYTAAYCLDIHLGATGGHPYTKGEMALADKDKRSIIGDILAQGYQYKGSATMPKSERSHWLVTQVLIWSAVNGTIKREKGLNVFTDAVTKDAEKIASTCGDYGGYFSYFYTLKSKLESMRKIPSFAYTEANIAKDKSNVKILSNKPDGSFSKTLTDTNKVLDHFNFKFDGAVSSTKSGNKLTLTASTAIEDAVVSKEAKYEVKGGEKSVICWKPADPSQQHFLTSNPQPDPVSAYLAVRTGEGDTPTPEEPIEQQWRASVQKRDVETNTAQGDATLAGAVYGVYQNGTLLDTYVTNSNGSFTTNYYDCGTGYTLKEISPSTGYLINGSAISIGHPGDDSDTELFELSYTAPEQVIKGTLRLTKHTDKGETGIETPEEGAEFQVYLTRAGSYAAAKSSERDILTIDKNGLVLSKGLPYGTYTIHQTKGWEGKEFVTDFSVFVSANGQVYAFILNNRVFEALITVMKKDVETGRVIPASGIGFKVRNTDTGKYVVQHINYPTPQDISIYYTDVTGKLMMPSALEYGHYELIEVATAYGYVLDSTPVPFTVDGTAKEVTVEKRNTPQKGRIRIHKQGEGFLSVSMENGLYTPVYGMVSLAGAEFSIIAAQDIYTPDGSLRFTAGEEVDTLTTDSLGECVSIPLYLGKYLIAETQAPEGYVKSAVCKLVEICYAGQTFELADTDVTFTDQRQKAYVDIMKGMEQDEAFHVGMGDEYRNVAFGLYAAEELRAADGRVIPIDGLIDRATVDGDNWARFTADVPCGSSLYIQEIATDSHYILSDKKWPLKFEYAGQGIAYVSLHGNSAHRVQNTLKRGVIAGSKVDEDGLLLAGAKFGLFFPDETSFSEDTAIQTAISATNGDFSFDQVPYGPWLVRELEPPEGFVLNETAYPVMVEENGQSISVQIENEFIKGSVKLEKIDADYTGEKLSGAAFDIYADSNGDGKYNTGDVKIGSLTETENGTYTMDDLRYGAYFAVEVKAPQHYELDPTPYFFEIRENGAIIKLSASNKPQLGDLLIKKTSEDGLVGGIKFIVSGTPYTGATYKQEFETDKSGEIHVSGLRLGEYTVSEVLDESTVRYVVEADKKITITYGGTEEVKFYNKLRRGSVAVIKTDPDYPGNKLTGAEFIIYQDMDYDQKFNSKRDTFYGKLEADNGVYWLDGLPCGGFFLQEAIAPEGYVRDTKFYYFEVNDGTKQLEVTNTIDPDAGFVNRRISGSLKIIKKSSGSGALLAGANFCVKDLDGQVIAEGTTDKNGELVFSGLKYGPYVYQEIYAPTGYEIDDREIPFQITKDQEVITVEVKNTPTPFYVPQTGDGRPNPAFYLVFVGISAIALGVGLVIIRKSHKLKEQEK